MITFKEGDRVKFTQDTVSFFGGQKNMEMEITGLWTEYLDGEEDISGYYVKTSDDDLEVLKIQNCFSIKDGIVSVLTTEVELV